MSTSTFPRLLLSILGSAVAPLFAAAFGVFTMLLLGWPDWRVCVFMVSIFLVPVWLLVLIPAYILLPRTSRLWRPSAAMAVGAAVGAVIITAYFALTPDAPFVVVVVFLPIAVLIGAVTGFIGSATGRYFHDTPTA